MLDAIVPGHRSGVDMAEMEACEGLRTRQDALADILERLAFRLADADNVTELAHHVEGAIEHRRPERVDGEIDAAAVGEVEHGLLEIFFRRDHHTLGAIVDGALFLSRRTDGAD